MSLSSPDPATFVIPVLTARAHPTVHLTIHIDGQTERVAPVSVGVKRELSWRQSQKYTLLTNTLANKLTRGGTSSF